MKEIQIRGHRFTIKRWTYGEKQQALRSSSSFKKDLNTGDMIVDVDPWKFNDWSILLCTVSWDLQDESGKPLEKSMEGLHSCTDPELVDELLREIQELNLLDDKSRKK
jgi:hypothetical protein